jgi:lysophospholipase L1-like esterase
MYERFTLAVSAALLVAACGGGNPSGPDTPTPTPPPVQTYSVTATVFYDENANGKLDASEASRVPGVEVVIGTGSGKSETGTGRAVVNGIQAGSFEVGVRPDSLPYYYQPLSAGTVQVPAATTVNVPLTLPIYANQPSVYFGYGDSITAGDGSSDKQGYALKLQNLLGPHFGRAQVDKFGRSGTTSASGLERAPAWIPRARAAYVLLLYGTNDWHDPKCQTSAPTACFTIDSLRGMIEITKDSDSLTVLGTLLPVNPALAPAGRNSWIDGMNAQIKILATQQQVLLADLNAEFKAQGNMSALYSDDVHPNDAGYQVLAQGWFKAISRARSAASSSRPRRFGFGPS